MKTFKYLIALTFLCLFACEKDNLPDKKEFLTTMEGRYFETTSLSCIKKDGTIAELKPGITAVTGTPHYVWFKDDKMYTWASIDEKDLQYRLWIAYREEKKLGEIILFVGHDFTYDENNGEITTPDGSFKYEQLGGRFHIETFDDEQMYGHVIYPNEVADDSRIFSEYQLRYQEQMAPDKSVNTEYHLFNSDEEAIQYMVERMGDWEPAEPLPPYFPD